MKAYQLLLFLLFSQAAWAQTTIRGTVQDQRGETIPGVNIFVKGTYVGTSSELNGSYVLVFEELGDFVLVFQALGFRTQEIPVQQRQEPLEISITLKEAINEMTAVTITAGALEASDEKRAVVLRPLDIVTVPAAMGDIIGAFQTLPGTATVGNDGRLFVRGGDASETAIFIDGLQVGNAFGTTASNVPTRTRFNPNLFKGSFFSTGGYSAEFGNALSSALSLNSVDMPLRSQGDISIMGIGGGINQTLVGTNNSLNAGANYTNLGPYQNMVRQNFDWEQAPASWDAEILGRQKLGSNTLLKAYARTERGSMKIWQAQPGIPQERGILLGVDNRYSFAQVSAKHTGKKDWSMYGGMSFSTNSDFLTVDQLSIRNTNRVFHAKGVAIKEFSDRFSLKSGLEHFRFEYREALPDEGLERSFEDQQLALFSEADLYLSNRLIFRTGLRAGYSALASQTWVDPRVSFAYKFEHEGQLSLAAGKYSQMPVEEIRVNQPTLQNTEAIHYILNYFLTKNGRTIRAESFYKNYDGLVTYEGRRFAYQAIQQQGAGFARGFDLFFRDQQTFENTDYWVTYSFVDSKRQFSTFQSQVQPGFAPKHSLAVVIKHFIPALKSQVGTSWSMNDGYTYTDPNLPGEMNSKTRGFQDLSLSWSYLPKPHLIIHLACSNVQGRDNIFGYNFSPTPNEAGQFDQLPIRQTAPRFLFLGIFITLSKDKSANQLNNL
ncbi:TonB-dependent receptor [Mongoliitalea daihaiensis]|uniref:TonB-dependent receptor n=1 Tax=Mongoliitalea daihaiensis TaxID=2782006 RepID=UPI001F366FE0|nr:TonB-dependent receptor [Mongoliitalea daihaiensis]UJP65108.1 TonB-dependent receptor [Mongoliitalea daihaiensis]